ncbi:MAG: hypothetical protein JSS11_06350 [Verrucomicrobia bacterium]|nr:hypothetical protein [Verrucomicrobiota bacterium]
MMSSTPAADVAKPANVTPEKLDTNQQTHALPWWIGRRWFALTYCVSKPYNFHYVKKPSKGGSKKGGGGDSQDAHCDIAGLVACGAADFLEAIEVNGDIVWSVPGGISRDGSHVEHTGDIVVDGIGTFRLHWGTETAAGDWLILNSGGEEHPYYRGQVVLEVQNLNCGSSESLPNIRVLLERAPVFSGLDGSRSREGANPITGIAELVENEFFGLGLTGTIDVTTAAAAASAIAARTKVVSVPGDPTHTANMGYLSAYVSDRQSFGSVLAAIMENYDGWVRRNGEKLELGFFTHPGTTPAGLVELSIHDLIDDPDFANRGPDDPEVITDAIVTGPDREWNMEDSYQKAGNDAVRERIQQLRSKSYARPFIVTSYQQKEQAQELVNFYSQPAQDTTLKWRREKVGALQPGDRFILNYSPSSLRQVFRIKQRNDPSSGGAVTLTIEPERGLAPLAYIAPAALAPDLPVKIPAVPIVNARMYQLPVTWPDLPALPALVALAERPSGPSKGFRVNFSVADVTYDALAETNYWALRGTLAATLTGSTLTFRINASGYEINLLEDQSGAAQNDDTLLLIVGNEVMSIGDVTAVGGNQYDVTVLRGRRGSSAATHASGDVLYVIPRAELEIVTHAELPRLSVTRYFKLQSFTPGDVQDLSAALKLTVSVAATIPTAPSVTATVGTGKMVELSWLAVTTFPVEGYEIARATGPSYSPEATIGAVSGTVFHDVVSSLGTTYRYRVRAISTDETPGDWSSYVYATTAPVGSGEIDSTVPTTPGSLTFSSNGTGLSGDGVVRAFIALTMPALPANAIGLDLLCRLSGATQWRLVDQQQAGAWAARVDDLTPGATYQFAVRSWTNFGIESAVGAVLSLTAPGKTATPTAPTNLVRTAGSASTYEGSQLMQGPVRAFCTQVKWDSNTDRDFSHFDFAWAAFGSSQSSVSAAWNMSNTTTKPIAFFGQAVPGLALEFFARTVDNSGNKSAWVGSGSLASYWGYPAGDMIGQSSNAVAVTGIATGSGASVRKVLTRAPINQVYTTVGGSPSEVVDIDLTGSGFHTAPDAGLISASDPGFGVEYYPDAGSPNSATNARVTLFTRNGSNLGAGWNIKLHGEFIEYD